MKRRSIPVAAYAVRRIVQVRGDRVFKCQSSERSRLERIRCRAGRDIGASCGLFDVPDILSYDDAAGAIVFRYIPDALPLKEYFSTNPDTHIAERCGQALGYIHLTDSALGDGNVFWHGDFGMGNVLFSEKADQLTIVDWSNAHWTGVPIDQSRGPAAFDLGIAIFSLFHRTVVYGSHVRAPSQLVAAFLRGYSKRRPSFRLASERQLLSTIHKRWRTYYLSRWGRTRTLAVVPSWVRVLRFLSSIERGS